MSDIKKEQTRKDILCFMQQVVGDCAEKRALPVSFPRIGASSPEYRPQRPAVKTDAAGLKVRIVYDGSVASNAAVMAERLQSLFDSAVMTDISQTDIRGGCIGCLRCGPGNVCAYDGSDGFRPMFEKMIIDADIIFFVGTIRDRYLSSAFKQFFDRSFYLNHKGIYEGKQICWLVSGPLGQIPNLRQIMEAYADVSRGNLAGIVTDESGDSAFIDAQISALAERAVNFAKRDYVAPSTFLGDAGRRLFRDEIWGGMRIVFPEDYRYYKKTGRFDFPQKKMMNRFAVPLLAALLKVPPFRKAFERGMRRGMIASLVKVVENA